MSGDTALLAHAALGVTTLCRLWRLQRRDGLVLGFTDHDRDLTVGDTLFQAASGLTARALETTTGLSVDNTEAMGALTGDSLSETDILAGRLDGAEVTIWLANWQAPDERMVLFAGTVGQITRAGGAFQAELRGLAERLNQPQGRVIQPRCSARLGDGRCGVDLALPAHRGTGLLEAVLPDGTWVISGAAGFAEGWFAQGMLSADLPGLTDISAWIRDDRLVGAARHLTLWLPPALDIPMGSPLILTAGCDRKSGTCRDKFNNFLNFRGFPHVPGEDWLSAYPVPSQTHDGGSMNG